MVNNSLDEGYESELDDLIEASGLDEDTDWITAGTILDVGGGEFLYLANGLKYVFTIDRKYPYKTEDDKRNKPKPVEKRYKGGDPRIKYQFTIHLISISVGSKAVVAYEKEMDKEEGYKKAYDKAMNLALDKDYILELTGKQYKQLATFLQQNPTVKKIALMRTGRKAETKFEFKKAAK